MSENNERYLIPDERKGEIQNRMRKMLQALVNDTRKPGVFTASSVPEGVAEFVSNHGFCINSVDNVIPNKLYRKSVALDKLRENDPEVPEHVWKMYVAAAHIDDLLNALCQSHCEYRIMDGDSLEGLTAPELTCDNRGNRLVKDDAYMIVTCSNGCKYYINVTADSVLTACAEVFGFVQYKL